MFDNHHQQQRRQQLVPVVKQSNDLHSTENKDERRRREQQRRKKIIFKTNKRADHFRCSKRNERHDKRIRQKRYDVLISDLKCCNSTFLMDIYEEIIRCRINVCRRWKPVPIVDIACSSRRDRKKFKFNPMILFFFFRWWHHKLRCFNYIPDDDDCLFERWNSCFTFMSFRMTGHITAIKLNFIFAHQDLNGNRLMKLMATACCCRWTNICRKKPE